MTVARVKAIEPGEYRFLNGIDLAVVVVGVGLGVVLGISLSGSKAVQGSYWSELLKVAGVSALPLVAIAVRLPRASGNTGWEKPARLLVFVAFPLVVGTIVLCLNRIAVTPKDGVNPADWLLIASGAATGLILAAVAVGVAADVLDKIDPASEA